MPAKTAMAGQRRQDLEDLKQPLLAMDTEDDYGKMLLFMFYDLYSKEDPAYSLIRVMFLIASL